MGLRLETFDAAGEAGAPPPGPSAEWLAGLEAGRAEGLSTGLAEGARAAEARSGAISADLAQSLADAAFGYAEARARVLAALEPLFDALIERLLPALAAAALGPWLVQALLDAAREDSAAPLVLHVHPDRLDAVRALLPPGWPAGLRADASLGPGDARLAQGGGETSLDLGACLASLREVLGAIHLPDRTARHG